MYIPPRGLKSILAESRLNHILVPLSKYILIYVRPLHFWSGVWVELFLKIFRKSQMELCLSF